MILALKIISVRLDAFVGARRVNLWTTLPISPRLFSLAGQVK